MSQIRITTVINPIKRKCGWLQHIFAELFARWANMAQKWQQLDWELLLSWLIDIQHPFLTCIFHLVVFRTWHTWPTYPTYNFNQWLNTNDMENHTNSPRTYHIQFWTANTFDPTLCVTCHKWPTDMPPLLLNCSKISNKCPTNIFDLLVCATVPQIAHKHPKSCFEQSWNLPQMSHKHLCSRIVVRDCTNTLKYTLIAKRTDERKTSRQWFMD